MRTEIPMAWTASAATKRLSWSWTTKRKKTRAAIPETTARKALILGGCRRTHVATAWIGLLVAFILGLSLFSSVSLSHGAQKVEESGQNGSVCAPLGLNRLMILPFCEGSLQIRKEDPWIHLMARQDPNAKSSHSFGADTCIVGVRNFLLLAPLIS